MTTMRGLGSTTSYNGGSARYDGLEDRKKTINLKDLPEQLQMAHELLTQLKAADPKGRQTVLERAQAKEPITQKVLKDVAALFDTLEMPLTRDGIAQFKAERGLGSGPSLAGPIAKSYARAVMGGEVLFRVSADEELGLRPADKACLQFLRAWSRTKGVGELMGRLKEALELGNPPVGADAAALANEYVGAQTVREVSKASSTKNCELTPDGMLKLIGLLEADKEKRAAAAGSAQKPTAAKAKAAPSPPPPAPTSTLPPKFAGSLPATRVTSASTGTTATTMLRPPSKATPADASELPTTRMQRPPAKLDSEQETTPRLPKPAVAPSTTPPRAPPPKR